ncbi:hypothetical protein PINS_up011283 [Pythium insidiosum]|nr:hypothetical protein PINS_up011283 [Pythium insidiosum]
MVGALSRCFPHCCPNHIERSYCGSSLHVIVQTDSDAADGSGAPLSRAKLADSVFLFARFECSAEPGLQVGDLVASTDMVRETQSEDNPEGRWIPGVKERASTLSSAMKSVAQAIGDHTLVYQLNGKVYSRWYYDWESGANKAQRLMRHVLKAYVFERCGPADADAAAVAAAAAAASITTEKPPTMLRVIGIVSSPEFTVISYRRAPLEAGQAMLPLSGPTVSTSAANAAAAASGAALYRGSPSMREQDELLRRQAYHGEYMHVPRGVDGVKRQLPGDVARWPAAAARDMADAKRRRHASPLATGGAGPALPRQRRYVAPAPTLRNASPAELFENRVLWEHANAHTVTVSKNLALVFWFIQWTPLDYYALFVDELIHLINHQLLEPLVSSSGGHVEKHNCFSRVLLLAAQFTRPLRAPLSPELEALVRVLAHAALWFFSSDMRWRMHAFLHRCNIATGAGSLLTDKARLRAAFLELVQDLEEQLNRHVFAATPVRVARDRRRGDHRRGLHARAVPPEAPDRAADPGRARFPRMACVRGADARLVHRAVDAQAPAAVAGACARVPPNEPVRASLERRVDPRPRGDGVEARGPADQRQRRRHGQLLAVFGA